MRPTGTTPPPSAGRRPGTVASFPPRHATFADRVMSAVARQPRPGVWRSFVTSLLRLHLGDAGAALRSAWRLAFERARPVMPLVRLQSLLLVVVLAALLGAGGVLAAGGAVRVFEELGRSGPGDRQPVVTGPSPGSTVAPGGDGAIELPSGDDGTGPGDGGEQRSDGERRQQDETWTHSSEEGSDAAARSPRGPERGGQTKEDQPGGVPRDDGEPSRPPRGGSGQPGPGTSRRTPAPELRQPQPSEAPGPGAVQAEPSPRNGGGTKGGDQA